MQHNETRVITHVGVDIKTGIYAPVTMNGVLLVDGVVVSAYVDFKAVGWVNTARSLGISPSMISHVSFRSLLALLVLLLTGHVIAFYCTEL